MARLLPVLILFGMLAAWLWWLAQSGTPARRGTTFRPRAKPGRGAAAAAAPGTVHVVRRDGLQGVRDAYTSAAIDVHRPLRCCAGCQAVYHETSLAALAAENGGRCVVCGGSDLGPVRVID